MMEGEVGPMCLIDNTNGSVFVCDAGNSSDIGTDAVIGRGNNEHGVDLSAPFF